MRKRKRRGSFLGRYWLYIVLIFAVLYAGVAGYSVLAGIKKEKPVPPPPKKQEVQVTKKNEIKKPQEPVKPPVKEHDYSITIDKGSYTLMVKDGSEVIKSYPVAIGAKAGQKKKEGDMTTPTGSFKVDEICEASTWTHDFGDGKGVIKGAYGPWFISLETPPWTGIGIHGTHNPKSIGTMVSEGCIRMHNEDVQELKEKYVKLGMPVYIAEHTDQ